MALLARALLLALSAAAAAALSASDETAARAAIAAQLGLGASYGAPCAPCAEGDTIGQLLRLAFHDAAGGGGPHGAGGGNGCIDATTSDNAGLADIQARVDAARAPFASLISRADFFVLAATVAVEAATTTPNSTVGLADLAASGLQPVAPLRLDMVFGRVDDANCAGVDAFFLPTPSCTWLGLVNVFGTGGRFQMDFSEITALMGAHTVGRMHRNASGIEGAWTRSQSSFGSAYYRNLLSHGHVLNGAQPDTYIDTTAVPSTGASKLVMLRSDVELIILTVPSSDEENFVNAPLVETQCMGYSATSLRAIAGSNCPFQQRSIADVQAFAANTALWHKVFRGAWRKLTEYAYAVDESSGLLVPGAAPTEIVRGFGGGVLPGHGMV